MLYEIAFLVNGQEVGRVDYDHVKVIGCIRRNGYRGKITPQDIINYVVRMVWNAGESWKALMDEEKASFYKLAYSKDLTPAQIAENAEQLISQYYGTDPLPGFNDDGTPIKTDDTLNP